MGSPYAIHGILAKFRSIPKTKKKRRNVSAAFVLKNQKPDRPVDSGDRVGGHEVRTERRIAEDQERGWLEPYAGLSGESLLVYFVKEPDALLSHVRFYAGNGLSHRIGALHLDDAVAVERGGAGECG